MTPRFTLGSLLGLAYTSQKSERKCVMASTYWIHLQANLTRLACVILNQDLLQSDYPATSFVCSARQKLETFPSSWDSSLRCNYYISNNRQSLVLLKSYLDKHCSFMWLNNCDDVSDARATFSMAHLLWGRHHAHFVTPPTQKRFSFHAHHRRE